MKLLFFVLSKPDLLHALLTTLADNGVKGATILESTGMGRELMDNDEISIFGSLRAILSDNSRQTKTLLMVLQDDMVQKTVKLIEKVVGPIGGPDRGIIFTVPIDFAKGLNV